MAPAVYRYQFEPDVPLGEVEHTLVLCLLAVQYLHGEAAARLTVGHHFDRRRRACVVDGRTPEGRDLAKLFTGFLAREFGSDRFRVEPARERPAAPDRGRDSREFRTLAEWVADLGLDPDQVAELLAADRGMTLDTALTAEQVDDLVGLAARAAKGAR
jgi:hypothetical protein